MGDSLAIRDIHLPEAISWWPPAVGWWLLLVLIPLSVYGAYYLYKRLTAQTAKKQARVVLQEIKLNSHSDIETLRALSAWLRRVVVSIDDRPNVAGLAGAQWLQYLDEPMDGQPFEKGAGQYLAEAQYKQQLPDDIDINVLIELCENWLKQYKGGQLVSN
jgi:hypothetical protein